MMDKTEYEVTSVFKHWCERSKKHPLYGEIKTAVRDRGISIRTICAQMDWDHFAPMTVDEYIDTPASAASDWDDDSDDT